ncbi:MAG: hypothetical protein ACP5MI_11535 [Candidatus Kryptoniota bacterium]
MFSKEYLEKLHQRTGFPAESLQKQMTLMDVLREMSRHFRSHEQVGLAKDRL